MTPLHKQNSSIATFNHGKDNTNSVNRFGPGPLHSSKHMQDFLPPCPSEIGKVGVLVQSQRLVRIFIMHIHSCPAQDPPISVRILHRKRGRGELNSLICQLLQTIVRAFLLREILRDTLCMRFCSSWRLLSDDESTTNSR